MNCENTADTIVQTVKGWPNITVAPHRFGGVEFSLGKREIGHIHGNSLVDIPFPRRVRDELVADGRAQPHRVVPDSGWVSYCICSEADVQHAIALLRQSYELVIAKNKRQNKQS